MDHVPSRIFATRKLIFVGAIMSSPDGDGNVGAFFAESVADRASGQIVAEQDGKMDVAIVGV
ncbi:MAG TPA: hypothetical protein VIJ35_25190 [Bradyrhizobium sp.]|jgi:hypothetical protein